MRTHLGRVLMASLAAVAMAGACASTPPVVVTPGAPAEPVLSDEERLPEEREAPAADPVESGSAATDQQFPDVVGVAAEETADGAWTFNVTISSPYDTPERYADAWRVKGADGTVYGERILSHDHAGEQPFTRSQSGIEIPDDVAFVIIEARDKVNGWGGSYVEWGLL